MSVSSEPKTNGATITGTDIAGYLAPNPAGVGPMTRAMLLTNVVLAAIKITAGLWGHSYAMVADGIESSRVPSRRGRLIWSIQRS